MSTTVSDYGWTSQEGPSSCGYIAPTVLSILRERVALQSRICDIGSGNGMLAALLKKEGYSPIGIEYDENGVLLSRKSYPDVHFYNLGVQDDPKSVIKEEGRFDVVVSTEVVEHLFSPHLLPVFSKQLLNSNGLLIISTPYHGYFKNLALSLLNKWDHHHTALWHGGHIKFWSRKTLSKLLEDNGFRVLSFHGTGRLPFLWKSMILVAQMK